MNWILFAILALLKAATIFIILVLVAFVVPIALSIFLLGISLNYWRDVEQTQLAEFSVKEAAANICSNCMKYGFYAASQIQHLLLVRTRPLYQKIHIPGRSNIKI